MDNIQIKRKSTKRNMESLIEDSGLDYNNNQLPNGNKDQQLYDLRKAFNQSLKDLGNQNNRLTVQLQKLKIINKRNQEHKNQFQIKLKALQSQYQKKNHDLNIYKKKYQHVKRKMQGLQYKIQQFQQNRQAAQVVLLSPKKNQKELQDQTINKVYKNISDTIKIKVKTFSDQLKNIPMSPQLEWKIQSFLEEMIYINPQSVSSAASRKNKNVGYITNRNNEFHTPIKLKQPDSPQKQTNQWRLFQKSIQKLKILQKNRDRSKTPVKKQKDFDQHRRDSSPVPKVSSNRIEQNILQFSHSKSRRKIFENIPIVNI